MNSLRILILAPGSNPDSISTALVGYLHSQALACLHDVTLVGNAKHETSLKRRSAPFKSIEVIDTPWLDAIYDWIVCRIFNGDYASQVLTALGYPFLLVFEWKAWLLLRNRIKAGEFDVVLRITPVVPTLASLFPFLLRKGPIPIVIGPINGGLPWPKGFSQAERQKEWITRFRNFYRIMPFSRSTFRYAKGIIAGSSQTCAEFSEYRDKVFFVPENGISQRLVEKGRKRVSGQGLLELIYVGRLVPYKACDMAIRAASPLVRSKLARMTIIGDGPERAGLQRLVESLGVAQDVSFVGWLDHNDTMQCLAKADVLVFPSIREFGGGVVFESLALGVVPVVADYGGPGDIVTAKVGYKVALTNEQDMIAQMEKILVSLSRDRSLLASLQERCCQYAHDNLSWEGKAATVTKILQWSVGDGPKPVLPPPKSPNQ